jgi:type I restriction enzyme S subunit
MNTRWTSIPLRQLLTERSLRNKADLPLLSVVREKGVIMRKLDKSENHNIIPEDLSNYKVVKSGQFVINKMKAWQGSCGVSKYDGIVSPAYFVFDLQIDNPLFFNYAIRSRYFIDEFNRISKGIRVGQWDLDLQQLKYLQFYIPPREEQDQITRFLDWKISKINNYIKLIYGKTSIDPKVIEAYPQSLLALLTEYRVCLISDVVTGKVDVSDVIVPKFEAIEDFVEDENIDDESDNTFIERE